MTEVALQGYVPGAIGRVAEMHARYYSREWGFGLYFEAKVASEVSEFLMRFESSRDGFWTVVNNDNRVLGSLAIDGLKAPSAGAHLRWFILSRDLAGQGWGNRLMEEAVSFCRDREYPRVYLWTFDGLHVARHLYEKFGFRITEQVEGNQWGTRVLEQKFVLAL